MLHPSPTPHRRPPRSFPQTGLTGWIVLGLITAGAATAAEAPPVGTFSLPDLNSQSPRLGTLVSPRDYGEWVSAYYFGNEA